LLGAFGFAGSGGSSDVGELAAIARAEFNRQPVGGPFVDATPYTNTFSLGMPMLSRSMIAACSLSSQSPPLQ
jgi:hypothetical protein